MSDNFSLTAADAPGLAYPVAPFLGLAKEVGITPRSLQRDRRDLYSAQWGFSIQQQLPAAFLTQIGYVGSSASKVTTRKYINNIDPVTKVRPLPTFGRMDEKNNDGNSNFNALQLSLHRRVARGLTWGTEYMWSHSINDNSIGGGEGSQPQNSFLPRLRPRQQRPGYPPHHHQQLDVRASLRPGPALPERRAGFEDPRRLGNERDLDGAHRTHADGRDFPQQRRRARRQHLRRSAPTSSPAFPFTRPAGPPSRSGSIRPPSRFRRAAHGAMRGA